MLKRFEVGTLLCDENYKLWLVKNEISISLNNLGWMKSYEKMLLNNQQKNKYWLIYKEWNFLLFY